MSNIQDRVLAGLVTEAGYAVTRFWESDYAEKCGSEIERAFAAAYILTMQARGQRVTFSREMCLRENIELFLEPQFHVGEYRVDFLLGSRHTADNLMKCIVIECDGHEFHDRTKEQAARDKSRDRFLSANVGRVLRFTGSELFKDPSACAAEASKILWVATLGFDPEKL